MAQLPKPLFVTGYVLLLIGVFLLIPVLIAVIIVFFIVTLPYTLFYFSPNFSLTRRDFQIVEVYLRHFERLYPDLMSYVAEGHKRNQQQGKPPGISFWPRKSKHMFIAIPGVSMSSSSYKFSQGAGFFGRLEEAGFVRRAVWEFLRDQVEPSGLVNELEKLDFQKVMDKMTSHQLLTRDWGGPIFGRTSNKTPQEKQEKEDLQEKKATELYGHLNRRIVRLRKHSPDCILHRGALLVGDSESRGIAFNLAKFAPVWGNAEAVEVNAEGGQSDYWQLVDAHTVWPWHDDC